MEKRKILVSDRCISIGSFAEGGVQKMGMCTLNSRGYEVDDVTGAGIVMMGIDPAQ